jgi:hypothetical protein
MANHYRHDKAAIAAKPATQHCMGRHTNMSPQAVAMYLGDQQHRAASQPHLSTYTRLCRAVSSTIGPAKGVVIHGHHGWQVFRQAVHATLWQRHLAVFLMHMPTQKEAHIQVSNTKPNIPTSPAIPLHARHQGHVVQQQQGDACASAFCPQHLGKKVLPVSHTQLTDGAVTVHQLHSLHAPRTRHTHTPQPALCTATTDPQDSTAHTMHSMLCESHNCRGIHRLNNPDLHNAERRMRCVQ